MSNERPWLDHYPDGVPAQIDVDAVRVGVAVLEEAFERFRDRPAFANFGKKLSYGEIDALSRAVRRLSHRRAQARARAIASRS